MQPPKRHRPGLVEAAIFTTNPLAYIRRQVAHHGPIFASHFLRYPTIIVAAEDAQRAVLVEQVDDFPWGYSLLGTDLFGQGLIILNGSEHDRHRGLMQPMMHRDHFTGYLAAMDTALADLGARWGTQGTVDLHPQLRHLTFAMATTILVGMAPGADLDRLEHLFAAMQTGTRAAVRRDIPGTRWGRALHARNQLDAALQTFIHERRDHPHADALGMLIAARDTHDAPFTDAQLIDEAKSLLFAGHESTTGVLTWTLSYLLRDPLWLARAIAAVAGDFDPGTASPVLDAILDEVIRLHPPSPYMMREVPKATTLTVAGKAYHIASGTLLILVPGYVHRDPRIFADPDTFRPDRWEDGALKRDHPFAFIPFGGGPRNCLGARLARVEMRAILAYLLTHYTLTLANTPTDASAYLPTDRPARPVQIHYTRKD